MTSRPEKSPALGGSGQRPTKTQRLDAALLGAAIARNEIAVITLLSWKTGLFEIEKTVTARRNQWSIAEYRWRAAERNGSVPTSVRGHSRIIARASATRTGERGVIATGSLTSRAFWTASTG
jgi:hypothetical protein